MGYSPPRPVTARTSRRSGSPREALSAGRARGLVRVGHRPHSDVVEALAKDLPGVLLTGARFGEECCACYALASAAVVPSLRDPWALVVNEAMASGLPGLVSRGGGFA